MQTKEKWSREEITNNVYDALYECGLIKAANLAKHNNDMVGDMPLAMGSLEIVELAMCLERAFSMDMNLETDKFWVANCTPNIIVDYLYETLNAPKDLNQTVKKMSWFQRFARREKLGRKR